MKLRTIVAAAIAAAVLSSPALAQSGRRTFHGPAFRGFPVDFCLYWSRACGMPAASRYCRGRGYQGAVSFVKRSASPTKVQGTGQVCDGPNCASFQSITCYEYGL